MSGDGNCSTGTEPPHCPFFSMRSLNSVKNCVPVLSPFSVRRYRRVTTTHLVGSAVCEKSGSVDVPDSTLASAQNSPKFPFRLIYTVRWETCQHSRYRFQTPAAGKTRNMEKRPHSTLHVPTRRCWFTFPGTEPGQQSSRSRDLWIKYRPLARSLTGPFPRK